MDRRLALAALVALPLLAALAAALPPPAGAAVALGAYWALLALAVLRADRDVTAALLTARRPSRLTVALLALPVLAWGFVTLRLLGRVPLPPHLLLAAALAALLHATLEELFWRGLLLPRATARAAAGALGLYWIAHLAWLLAAAPPTGLPPAVALLAPLALGGAWTAARLETGTLGAGLMAHAGLALFVFAGTLARTAAP
ncbi:CPBP family glutamic-type intramembrane protease [Rubellimicrobium aerolatum]|uniref:Type II CAAX prenyl endopeptidase Rce1 family protein n=1 Tax=Rubellimicrobium aerolatum TaxID=490979 RepID=A0ABW0SAT0_9RHOB|nr:CPBP family glutamic-type intramembrane protease [Rubellimicrobium aerolatum]MBP1805319.1 hypothetical protein [Rubellimicrobium aerolatum]